VTLDARGFCWGVNLGAQLGDGTKISRTSPTPLAVSLSLSLISTGGSNCGVTTGHRAYCWGSNYLGQVGDGTTAERLVPTAVVGPM
jgi:alpha-tubulin suppressor-like RCC1 family protein